MTDTAYLPVCVDDETEVDCIIEYEVTGFYSLHLYVAGLSGKKNRATRGTIEMKILLPSKEILELPTGISLLDAIKTLKQHNAALTGVVYKGYYQTRSIN